MTSKDTPEKSLADNAPPHKDHSLDQAAPGPHKDPRLGDVGAAGALERDVSPKAPKPGPIDHGIDRVLKEEHEPYKDHGSEGAHRTSYKDGGAEDVGASGATRRK